MTAAAVEHGTPTGYQAYRCRCDACSLAQAAYRRALRDRHRRGESPRVDATGTIRRIHALQALGWPLPELMARLGLSYSGTWLTYADRVSVRTARRVACLYDELAMTAGPSQWTRTWATNRGYLPPLAWDDDRIDDPTYRPPRARRDPPNRRTTDVDWVIVDRLATGQPVEAYTRAERLAAVARMHRNRLTYLEMADRLHVAKRQVSRDLADQGLTNNVDGGVGRRGA